MHFTQLPVITMIDPIQEALATSTDCNKSKMLPSATAVMASSRLSDACSSISSVGCTAQTSTTQLPDHIITSEPCPMCTQHSTASRDKNYVQTLSPLMHLIHIRQAPQQLINCVSSFRSRQQIQDEVRSTDTADYILPRTRIKSGECGFC